jgi:hypothetical protein
MIPLADPAYDLSIREDGWTLLRSGEGGSAASGDWSEEGGLVLLGILSRYPPLRRSDFPAPYPDPECLDWADQAAFDLLGDPARTFEEDEIWGDARYRLAGAFRVAGWMGRLAAWLLGATTTEEKAP